MQFLEGLSICPKRGRKDLNNLLWHGVKSCKEAEFHTSHIKEAYGSRVSSESLSIVTAFRHLWHLNSIYINITFSSAWNINTRWCSFQVPCHSWGNCPFVSLCLIFLTYLSNSFPSQFESNVTECLSYPWVLNFKHYLLFQEGNPSCVSLFFLNVSMMLTHFAQHFNLLCVTA